MASNKKTGVAEHLEVFRHAGLHFNEPRGTARLLFVSSTDQRNPLLTEPQFERCLAQTT